MILSISHDIDRKEYSVLYENGTERLFKRMTKEIKAFIEKAKKETWSWTYGDTTWRTEIYRQK